MRRTLAAVCQVANRQWEHPIVGSLAASFDTGLVVTLVGAVLLFEPELQGLVAVATLAGTVGPSGLVLTDVLERLGL